MNLHINFHRLALTQGSSYTVLLEWLKSKNAVINAQNQDKECFNWAVIAGLNHEEIKHHPERISFLRTYEKEWLEFPVLIKKTEKNNSDIAVNVLFSNIKSIYTARSSGRNMKCKKQVNLLMIVDGEERYYTAIKNISRLL